MLLYIIDGLTKRLSTELMQTPRIRRIMRRDGSPEDYAKLLTPLVHYVPEVSPCYRIAANRAERNGRDADYVDYLRNQAKEEEGHDALALNDLTSLKGAPPVRAQPSFETQTLIKWMREVSSHGPESGIAVIGHIVSSQAALLGPALLESLVESGFPVEFLELHVELDTESHCKESREYLGSITDSIEIERDISIAYMTVVLYPQIFAEDPTSAPLA
ncbi:hypothetical protein [Polyangium mundeleinium]|uniref:Iron-containing redox enzyme family protein n=1 Tax=Polyangium mundeleinium TaxID=2995306 RepID=A0ABT5EN05_9BACT|nr:hypothetical protein [Polyangium mundeleinium]MDC0743222.1 hypothetical protein [Polyangium mundeleinium]